MKPKFEVGDIVKHKSGMITKEIVEFIPIGGGSYINKSSSTPDRDMKNSQDYIEDEYELLTPGKIRNTKLYKALK